MGVWGEGPLDNDTAGDLEVFWNDTIVAGRARDASFLTADRIATIFERLYFGGYSNVRPDLQVDAEKILAVGALFVREGLELPPALKDLVERAINYELGTNRLSEWEERSKRRKALLELLTAIGGTKKRPSKAKRPPRKETAELEAYMKHAAAWVGRNNLDPVVADAPALPPPAFLTRLRSYCFAGTKLPDPIERRRAIRARLQMLAFFLTRSLHMRTPESLALIATVDRLQHPAGPDHPWRAEELAT